MNSMKYLGGQANSEKKKKTTRVALMRKAQRISAHLLSTLRLGVAVGDARSLKLDVPRPSSAGCAGDQHGTNALHKVVGGVVGGWWFSGAYGGMVLVWCIVVSEVIQFLGFLLRCKNDISLMLVKVHRS